MRDVNVTRIVAKQACPHFSKNSFFQGDAALSHLSNSVSDALEERLDNRLVLNPIHSLFDCGCAWPPLFAINSVNIYLKSSEHGNSPCTVGDTKERI
jgi:hypothetical protein